MNLKEIEERNKQYITPNVGEAEWLIAKVKELELKCSQYDESMDGAIRHSDELFRQNRKLVEALKSECVCEVDGFIYGGGVCNSCEAIKKYKGE